MVRCLEGEGTAHGSLLVVHWEEAKGPEASGETL